MTYVYSRHVLKRMWQHELTSEMIESAVSQPDHTQPAFRGRYLARKKFHDKILEVVYLDTGGQRMILITAYWLEESR